MVHHTSNTRCHSHAISRKSRGQSRISSWLAFSQPETRFHAAVSVPKQHLFSPKITFQCKNLLAGISSRTFLSAFELIRYRAIGLLKCVELVTLKVNGAPNREFFRGRLPRQSYAQMLPSCDRWEAQVGRQFASLRRLGEQGKGQ